jgi:excisionase family DNA binding protein
VDAIPRPLTRTDVMTSGDVSVLLGIPRSTVEDWARRGLLPSRKRGKRRFYLRWEIEAWLTAQDSG